MEPILLRGLNVSTCRSLRRGAVFSKEGSTFLPNGYKPGNSSFGDSLEILPAGSLQWVLYLHLFFLICI